MCCLRQLFTTCEFSLTVMSLCGLVSQYSVGMFCCVNSVTTAPQHQMFSVRICVPFASRVVGMPHLDCGNATLTGLPASQLCCLQSVLNAAARLIHRSPRYEYVTPMLQDLHWLESLERIDFKLAVLVYRCLHGLVPCHSIFPTTSNTSPTPTADVFGRHHLAACDPTYTAVHRRRACVSGGWKPPLVQSAA